DNHAILTDDDTVGIGLNLHRTADGAGKHRVSVVVEANQAGLRHRGRDAMEAVEAAGIGNEVATLGFEHLPDGPLTLFGMPMHPRVGDDLIKQPGVELLQVLEAEPRRKEALAHQPDLVLYLTLLPARRRRAGHRLNEIVPAHLLEATIVPPFLADEDRLYRRL